MNSEDDDFERELISRIKFSSSMLSAFIPLIDEIVKLRAEIRELKAKTQSQS